MKWALGSGVSKWWRHRNAEPRPSCFQGPDPTIVSDLFSSQSKRKLPLLRVKVAAMRQERGQGTLQYSKNDTAIERYNRNWLENQLDPRGGRRFDFQ